MGILGLAGYLFGGLGEPGLQVRPDRCLRASGSGCRVCVEICPAAALRLGPQDSTQAPQSERSRCTDCGLCAATCPSGAIAGVGVPPGALTREAERRSLDMSVVCAPARQRLPGNDDSAAFSVSCLAALHPETVVATALALQPGATLTLTHAQCSQCPSAQQAQVKALVQESMGLLQRVDNDRPDSGGQEIVMVEMSVRASDTQPRTTERPSKAGRRAWSRRELLTAGRSGARAAPAPAVTPARAELLSQCASPATAALQLTHPLDAQGCTFCHACAAVCPTEALRIGRLPAGDTLVDDGAVSLQLAVDPSRCLGCSRCAQVCVDDLLILGRGPKLAALGKGKARGLVILAQGKRSACHTCNQPLAPGEQDVCRRCESGRTLLSDVLVGRRF